jgi:two-component sensor histidine kinase
VLVVDDEGALTEMLCRGLERAGYRASGYTSARAALADLRPGEFDLLLTDVAMPEMSGIDLLRAALQIDADLAGIMITGNGTVDTAVAAMRIGAVDYILKPFKLGVVVSVVARALETRRLRRENSALTRRLAERAEQLRRLNEELEERVEQRTHDLRVSLEEKAVLLREVHHRVRNNLQVIGSMLTMQAESPGSADCAGVLQGAYRRVWSLAVIQGLFDGRTAQARVDFGQCVETLCEGLLESKGIASPGARLEVGAEAIHLAVSQASTCALIVNELVSNALRHAFGQDGSGTVRVTLRKTGDWRAELAVSDDGQGLPPDFHLAKSRNLGLQLVDALVAELGGKLDLDQQAGTAFRIEWSLEAAPEGSSRSS